MPYPVHPMIMFCRDLEVKRWSKCVESNRKDVECTFGILKGRFRILKVFFQPVCVLCAGWYKALDIIHVMCWCACDGRFHSNFRMKPRWIMSC